MAGYVFRWTLIAGAALTAAACSSYPDAPRYSTRADGVPPQPYPNAYPAQPTYPAQPAAPAPYEAPPPLTAPIGNIEGGALPSPGSSGGATMPPVMPPPLKSPPATSWPTNPAPGAAATAGSAYVIQPGDTISGVGRRFRTPVQSLIDLNALGPQGTIRAGQSILLPTTAVDAGADPYATGPAPVGVTVGGAGTPPPPAPPRGNPAVPRPQTPAPVPAPAAPAPQPATPAAPVAGAPSFQWPVRGDILRRFGPVGLGERNNGINIGASAGTSVVAAGPGRVAYVGDAIPGAGLTVLIMHRDGWRTVYGHLGSATVDDGDEVRAGQQLGTVGLTAGDGRPSIHFETRRMQGDNATAVDPLTVLPR